jgi:membrane-bound lytic murein transglycosylase B
MKRPLAPPRLAGRSYRSALAYLLAFAAAFATTLAAAPAAQGAQAARHGASAKKSAAKAARAKPVRRVKAAPAPTSNNDSTPDEHVNFAEWTEVDAFIGQMVSEHGFVRGDLEAVVRQIRFADAAVELMKPAPPGKAKDWQAYRDRIVGPARIEAGAAFWNGHADALARAEQRYGVPAEIIVGIIGVETMYGKNTGRFRVLDALTTLAFAYPGTPNRAARMAFFKGELESALLFARESGIDPLSLLGSYAGAVGLPQFMPSNIMQYGVDFDGDGSVDLRNSAIDAIGSVANFLVEHGWQRDDAGPTVYPATVGPGDAWGPLTGLGLKATLSQDALAAAGVTTAAMLPADSLFGLVDLQNGAQPTEYWLGANNFFAITQYNRSYFYAMSVIELGHAVTAARSGRDIVSDGR